MCSKVKENLISLPEKPDQIFFFLENCLKKGVEFKRIDLYISLFIYIFIKSSEVKEKVISLPEKPDQSNTAGNVLGNFPATLTFSLLLE